MNALQFVNSKDIRAHLEKIGYKFSPTETAWLIYHSRNHTLAEKHAAWRKLAEEYPDAPFSAEYDDDFRKAVCPDTPFKKLSGCLRLYIDTEEKLLMDFSKNDGSFVYCVDPLDEDSYMEGHLDELFTRAFFNFKTCMR